MYTEGKKNIVVTWDFTEMSEFAIAHAIGYSKQLTSDIVLLHIVKKETEIQEAETKLKQDAERINKNYGIQPKVQVVLGDIFHSIGDYTSDTANKVNLVVMGTHGMRGMQKITGSWALKVIASSNVPFVVVQDMPQDKKLTDLVCPIDIKAENKEKLVWAIYMAQFFGLKIHIYKEAIGDKYYQKKVNNNLTFAKKYLTRYNIAYEIHTAEEKGRFEQQLIDFASKINTDLILVITTKNIGFADYVFGASEQIIIANNAKVPIMCVNPRTDLMVSNFWS